MLISLISRSEKWTNVESLVGHDFACDVVKFNPKIFSSKENDTSKVHSVIASGGSDRTMAIWNTSKSTPLPFYKMLFKEKYSILHGLLMGHLYYSVHHKVNCALGTLNPMNWDIHLVKRPWRDLYNCKII